MQNLLLKWHQRPYLQSKFSDIQIPVKILQEMHENSEAHRLIDFCLEKGIISNEAFDRLKKSLDSDSSA